MQPSNTAFNSATLSNHLRQSVPFVTAILLIVAAGAKAEFLSSQPTTTPVLWGQVGLITFEFALGAWLVSGLQAYVCRVLTLLVFIIFAIVTMYKWLSGEISCGCFGHAQVGPGATLWLDLSIIALLFIWRPGDADPADKRQPSHKAASFATLAFYGVLIASVVVVIWNGVAFSFGPHVRGQVIVLEPETWIGTELPILRFVDIGESLRSGEWLVVLYHHDCSDCQAALPKYALLAKAYRDSGKGRSIALVEIPPFSSDPQDFEACKCGRLSDSYEWFVVTPTVLHLRDGIVIAVPQHSFESKEARSLQLNQALVK